jgi:uncharacterized membrane protein YhaH (DUF805 family)
VRRIGRVGRVGRGNYFYWVLVQIFIQVIRSLQGGTVLKMNERN